MGRCVFAARLRRWRATRGTPEWHRATAEIRAAGGQELAALVHRWAADLKEALIGILEAAIEVRATFVELTDGTDSKIPT